jgi:spermidine synthase
MVPRSALLTACALSGGSALVYQVLWSRQLALVVGGGTEAVAIVLSSFMAGLGLGSALAGRVLDRLGEEGRHRAVLPRAYACLEGVLALAAILLPLAFARVGLVLQPLYEGPEASPLAFRLSRLVIVFALLVLPTTAMGATLPLLVALAESVPERAAAAAAALYAANTVGAVAGALLTPLAAFPALGLTPTGWLAAAGNVSAGLLVLAAGRGAAASGTERRSVTESGPALPSAVRAALAVSFASGLGALAHEVAWTRALALLLGPTVHTFAFVLAAVIAGLALGSAVAGRVSDRLRHPALALAAVQSGVAASALVIVPMMGWLPLPIGEAVRRLAAEPGRLVAYEGLGILAVLLVPAALFGATFPLCVRMVAASGQPVGAAVARVLAWNTLGALLGPLLAAFVLLPRMGLQATLIVAAGIHATAALLALGRGSHGGRPFLVRAALVAPALGLALLPRWDLERLAGGAYRYAHREAAGELDESLHAGELVYYRDGALGTVSVKRLGGTKALAVDGKVDATDSADMATQRLLAHLPMLLHGAAREVLVVGLGSGATAASALGYDLATLDVVEISPEVVEAARLHFGAVNAAVFRDPRTRLRVGDARNHLLLTRARFDVVISEPSNPWMAGVASLFTRDFFALVRSRLRAGGLFAQWMHVYGLPVESVRSVLGSFADVFPQSAVFQVSESDLVLVGSEAAWPEPEAGELQSRMSQPRVAADLRGIALTRPGTLAGLFVLGPGRLAAVAGRAPRHTDERPILELRAARAMLANTAAENRRALLEAAGGPPVQPWAGLVASLSAEDHVERGRLLERASGFSMALEAYGKALRLDPRSAAAQEGLSRIGAASEAGPLVEDLLRKLASGPDPRGARVSLARLYRGEGRIEEAGRELEAVLAQDPSDVRALKLVAAIQGDLGQAGAAEVFAGRAQTLAPRDAEAAALLASASLLAGEAETALERADAALRLDGGMTLAWRVRALALARLRRPEARTAFEGLVERDGGSWTTWTEYGAFLLNDGDPRAAAKAFEEASDLAPDSAEAWRGLSRASEATGDRRQVARAQAALRRVGE